MNEKPISTPPPYVAADAPYANNTATTSKLSIKWPIVLMAWPLPVLLLSIILYALSAFLFQTYAPVQSGDELYAAVHPAQTIANVALFLIGALTVLLGPISFIAGLIMLIVRLSSRNASAQPPQ